MAVATSSVVAALVEFVAVVAVEALPDSVAVIVPAEKLPEASRATSLEAVLADVASAAIVTAAEPLYEPPVRYEPIVNALDAVAVTVIEPPRLTAEPLIVTDELASLALAIEPASIVLVTVPVSPVVMAVPVVAGIVNTVPVPAAEAGIT